MFEVGENSGLGILTWGAGSLSSCSHRTIIADFADALKSKPAKTVGEAMSRWIDAFFKIYKADDLVKLLGDLDSKSAFNVLTAPASTMRTKQEEDVYTALQRNLIIGFCMGGRAGGTRTPEAFEVVFEPLAGRPSPVQIPLGKYRFWGVPNMADRLISGTDMGIRESILNSPFWTGSEADFDAVLAKHVLSHPILPIRDAIDFVHTCIHSTIKALKFSAYNQICGGPIEIAAVTTDRPFRWVRHKKWDAALLEGEP